ncbi:MAG TPA: Rho termination factor N-terminal domain-containing protein [Syntrophobacter fumaroxidans]|nr:Rho termination factor N-terminal domain-containing protein [Syntrophobacter fumaroxidans]
MGKQKDKTTKEKPLDKMTAKELRELAMTLEGIVGVHAMNKNELIAAIKEAKGIVDDKSKKSSIDVRGIKVKVRELKERREKAKEEGNRKLADAFRRRISNLKKRSRRAA